MIMGAHDSRRTLVIGCMSLVAVLATRPAATQESPPPQAPTDASQSRSSGFSSDNLYFGGGVGLSFGDVDYVEIEPLVGYRLTPEVSVGASLIYRYRNDDRYDESLSTSDYGGSLFGQYQIAPPLFAHAEVEYLSYEYLDVTLSNARDSFTSVFLGGGLSWPVGGHASLFAMGLYNFTYDDNDPSPYSSPWEVRVGVGFGF